MAGEDEGKPEETQGERTWKPPERSDQPPGEEVVQVNDTYTGGGPPPDKEHSREDEQHPHGG